jgi:hypothetical protein
MLLQVQSTCVDRTFILDTANIIIHRLETRIVGFAVPVNISMVVLVTVAKDKNVTSNAKIEPKCTLWGVLCSEQKRKYTDTSSLNVATSEQTLREELQKCDESEQIANEERPFNATNVLYYQEINMDRNDDSKEAANLMQTLSRHLRSNILSRHQLIMANIAYIAFDNVLVYDRYRQNEKGFLELSDHNKGSIIELLLSAAETGSEDVENKYRDMTATILNHILMFLPDHAVATMELVCRNWYNQIRITPMIWISMLERRGWSNTNENSTNPSSVTLRESFSELYTMFKDMTSLHSGFNEICHNEVALTTQRDYFACRVSSCGDDVKVWSDNGLLILSDEGSLRLFERKSDEYAFCESISESVNWLTGDGYGLNSRTFELDEEYIYVTCVEDCLFRNGRFQMAAVKRNDFIAENDGSAWLTLDFREAVINYMVVKCDDPLDPVIDFLLCDGTEDDILLSHISPSILPCGHGQFLFEVVMTTQQLKQNYNRNAKRYFSWKLCLFSMSVNSIVWTLELDQFSSKCSYENALMSCVRRTSTDNDTQPTCDFTVWDRCSGKILLGQVYGSGTVTCSYTSIQVPIPFVSGWNFDRLDITYLSKPEWEYYRKAKYLIDTPTDIIMSYVKKRQTVNCFYRKNADGTIEETCTELPMTKNLMVMSKPSRIRGCYVAFVCRDCDDGVLTTIVIHVPSRIEVCRITMDQIPVWDRDDLYKYIPRISSDCNTSIGLCSTYLGLVMTGFNIRNRSALSTEASVQDVGTPMKQKSTKRAAAERSSKKKRKKDAFSRGSQRM